MPALVDPTEAFDPIDCADAVLWRYLRLRHAIGSYCFGWRYGGPEGDLLAFSYDAPEYREGAPS